jgi:outer membrane protein assembly factor BamB
MWRQFHSKGAREIMLRSSHWHIRQIVAILFAMALLATAWSPAAQAQSSTAIRVLAVDADTGTMSVLDGAEGTILATFAGPGGGFSAPFVTEDGRYFVTNFYESNATVIIDSGIYAEDHGDHQDLHVEKPALVAILTSQGPGHYWAHGEHTLIYSDGDGDISVLGGDTFVDGAEPATIEVEADHATIAAIGDTVIVGYSALGRIDLYDIDGTLIEENVASCVGTHGEAPIATGVAFACEDAIVLIEGNEPEEFTYTRIPYEGDTAATPDASAEATPAEAPAARSNVLASNAASDILTGDFPGGILLIDPVSGSTSMVSLPATPRWITYTSDGSHVLTIADDGTVYAIDPNSGEIVWQAPVAAAHADAAPEDMNALYPFVTSVGDLAFVGDPGTGEVIALDIATGEIVRQIEVGGRPARLVATSASGLQH